LITSFLAIFLLLGSFPVLASPYGGQVISGQAAINQAGSVTNINQNTNKAVINWQGFSIGSGETVNFIQPSAQSSTLNRVIGHEKSLINGALNANGQVFVINSNGVLFGKGASVSVKGLVASTLNIKDADYNQDKFVFEGQGLGVGEVLNQGNIQAAQGGYVALLGDQVLNEGVISAEKGTVSLNGANRVTLNFNDDSSLASVTLEEGSLKALVATDKAIYADGGQIILTAKAINDLTGSQVNTGGIVQAQTLNGQKGNILVYAYGGTAKVNGKLDASAPNGGDGGFIETSGDYVKIAEAAVITAKALDGKNGTFLIDPTDYTIASSGGDATGAQVSKWLASQDTIISSDNGKKNGSGDINVNDAITWSSNNKLTLDAVRDININAPITAYGNTAGLILVFGGEYNIRTKASYAGVNVIAPDPNVPGAGLSTPIQDTSGGIYGSVTLKGSSPSLEINEVLYELIKDINEFKTKIEANPEGNFALVDDFEGGVHNDKGVVTGSGSVFTGVLAGLGHKISNLIINDQNSDYNYFEDTGLAGVGLFSQINGAFIRDLGLIQPKVNSIGGWGVGALVGQSLGGIISQVYSEKGQVTGYEHVGGLIGTHRSTYVVDPETYMVDKSKIVRKDLLLDHVYCSDVLVKLHSSLLTNDRYVKVFGGIIGSSKPNIDNYATVIIKNSFVTGEVGYGFSDIGGIGGNIYGNIINSWANTSIQGTYVLGGLAATLNGSIINSFSQGDIIIPYATTRKTDTLAGGITAKLEGSGSKITNSYSSVNINVLQTTVSSGVGGLLGWADPGTIIEHAHATGDINVGSAIRVGGIIGDSWGSEVSWVYATGNISGGDRIGGLIGNMTNENSLVNSYFNGHVANGSGLIAYIYNEKDYTAPILIENVYAGDTSGASSLIGMIANPNYANTGDRLTINNAHWLGNSDFNYIVTEVPPGAKLSQVGSIDTPDNDFIVSITQGKTPTQIVSERVEAAAALAAAEAEAAAKAAAEAEAAAIAAAEAEAAAKAAAEAKAAAQVASEEASKSTTVSTNLLNSDGPIVVSSTISVPAFDIQGASMDAVLPDITTFSASISAFSSPDSTFSLGGGPSQPSGGQPVASDFTGLTPATDVSSGTFDSAPASGDVSSGTFDSAPASGDGSSGILDSTPASDSEVVVGSEGLISDSSATVESSETE
jgi:filamentous hemagglutinin family protein